MLAAQHMQLTAALRPAAVTRVQRQRSIRCTATQVRVGI